MINIEFLGIDIGGTKCAVVRGDENGIILEKVKFATSDVGTTIRRIFDEAENLRHDSVAVGISCGGPLDSRNGIIMSPPNLPGWDNIKITDMIEERLGLPAFLCNDANASALAEYNFGAGKGSKNMIFLTCGTGMGAGLILNGRLYEGANGNAGEVGHMRLENYGPVGYGKMGSFEGFASGGGIAMLAKLAAIEVLQRGGTTSYCKSYDDLNSVNAKTVAIAATEGDKTALKVYEESGRMLGRAVALLVDIINPDRIVIGSIFARAESLLRPAMEEVLKKEALEFSYAAVSVVAAGLGDNVGDLAALSAAMECYNRINSKNNI